MVKLGKILTPDDMIVEYMMYKVVNGYEPYFTGDEFITFLQYFETKMKVEEVTYDKDLLFNGFFNRMIDRVWWSSKDYIGTKRYAKPHMNLEFNDQINDYIITANYFLSDYDKSVISTYYMDNGMSKYDDYKGTAWKIRQIIGEYLKDTPKRTIDETTEIEEKDLTVGKYIAAEILTQIWYSYIDKKIESNRWPKQCKDINKYLFEIDLATMIEEESIKDELLNIYRVFSKRIAILYSQDKNLKVSSYESGYLARANYKLLIKGYEQIMNATFGPFKKSLEFDLSAFTFKESHEADGIYDWDEDAPLITTSSTIGNDKIKTLVKHMDEA